MADLASGAISVVVVLWVVCAIRAQRVIRPWEDAGSLSWLIIDTVVVAIYSPWILAERSFRLGRHACPVCHTYPPMSHSGCFGSGCVFDLETERELDDA